MTCAEYVRGAGPLGVAFEVTVKLEHGRTCKHIKSEWDKKFEAFKTERR